MHMGLPIHLLRMSFAMLPRANCWDEMVTERVDLLARVLMSRRSLRPGSARSPRSRRLKATFGVPGFLIWPAAALELTSAVLLLVALGVQPVALVLAGWCLLTAAIFHTSWSDQIQQIMILKKMTMAGGFLMLAKSRRVSTLCLHRAGTRRLFSGKARS